MRILALDIGSKRIGVAVSDPLGYTAQGVKTLAAEPIDVLWQELDTLVDEYQPEKILVGLPVNMDGSESKQTKSVLHFVAKMRRRFLKRSQVITWDERLSSLGAERALLEADLSRNKRKKVIDKMAAVFILQGYLESLKGMPPC